MAVDEIRGGDKKMTFEQILPKLREGAFIIRDGWGGAEEYVKLFDPKEFEGQAITPYFLISVAGEGFSMFQPTVCDILAEDWSIVDPETVAK